MCVVRSTNIIWSLEIFLETKEIIFLVEDDELYLDMYKQVLGDEFDTRAFTCAREALSNYNELKPKAIVLDLNLPDITGVEFCDLLFSEYCSSSEVDIIFVSGEVNPKIKLRAFEVGAADYIVKPFEIQELKYKVHASVSRKLKELHLLEDALESQKVVYTTMAQASQYGQVMNFFKNLSNCRSNAEAANTFFDCMSCFGLISSVRFKLPEIEYYRHDGLGISPIEKDIYSLLESKGRIFEFSNRIIINDEHVSFIIKNPPTDENDLGQLRDYTASIVEGLEAKILDLYGKRGMEDAIFQLSSNIEELKSGVNQHSKLINAVMSDMLMQIAGSYHSLEMTESQESFLNDLVENGTQKFADAEEHLIEIMTKFQHLKQNMENVQKAVKPPEKRNIESNDIELF